MNPRPNNLAESPVPPHGRAGVTLVELLVVLVLIAIIATIVTVGINSVLGGQQERDTQTRLEALRTMLTEYARNTRGGVGAGASSTSRQLPASVVGNALFTPPNPGVLQAAKDTAFDMDDTANRYYELAQDPTGLARTHAIMIRLVRVPTNRAAIDELPTEARLVIFEEGSGGDPVPDEVPVLVDGFDTPILFVPPAGVTGLDFGDAFPGWDSASGPRLVARDGKAFFMSAGVDGDFTTGGDNLYSSDTVAVDAAGSEIVN